MRRIMEDDDLVEVIARHVGETWARGSLAKVDKRMRDVVESEFPDGDRRPRLADGLVELWRSARSSRACLDACRNSMRDVSPSGREPSEAAAASMLVQLALSSSCSAFAVSVAADAFEEVLDLVRREPLFRAKQLVRHAWNERFDASSSSSDTIRVLVREAMFVAFGDERGFRAVTHSLNLSEHMRTMEEVVDVWDGDYSPLPDYLRAFVAAQRGDVDAILDNLTAVALRHVPDLDVGALVEILVGRDDHVSMRRLVSGGYRVDLADVVCACRRGSIGCIRCFVETHPNLAEHVSMEAAACLGTGRVGTYLEILELVGQAESPLDLWYLGGDTSPTGVMELERRELLPDVWNPRFLAERAAKRGNWDLVRWLRDERGVDVDESISKWSYATGMNEVREFRGSAPPSDTHYEVAIRAGVPEIVEHLEVEHGMGWSLREIASTAEVFFLARHVDSALLRPRPQLEGDDDDWAMIFTKLLTQCNMSDHRRLASRVLYARPAMVPASYDLDVSSRKGLVDVSLEIARRLTRAAATWHVPEHAPPYLREMLRRYRPSRE